MDIDPYSREKKMLQKNLKQAKIFAIQRQTRRIKMLKNKRGTDQQLEKNKRRLSRLEEEMENMKVIDIDAIIAKIQAGIIMDPNAIFTKNMEDRAMWKLILSKPIQDYLSKKSLSVEQKTTKYKDLRCPLITSRQKDQKQTTISECQEVEENGSLQEPNYISEKDNKNQSDNDRHFPDDDSNQSDSSFRHDDLSQSDHEFHCAPKSYFVDSLSSKNRRRHNTTKENDAQMNNKKYRKQRKKSTNRMGQRARQRLWRKQYGGDRKHDKALRKENEIGTRKANTGEHRTRETTHPSWEASKRLKLQQNINKITFQGQRITFDDSD